MPANNIIKQAFILTAGHGRRLQPLTKNTPKPLIKVNDQIILENIIIKLIDFGIEHIIVNCHYLAEQIQDFVSFCARKFHNIKFDCLYENPILDSGGAIKNALTNNIIELNKPLFVINGDIMWLDNINNTLKLLNNNWNNSLDLLMLITTHNLAIGYDGHGDLNIDENYRPITSDKKYIFTGMQIIKPVICNQFNNNIFSLREIYFGTYNVKTVINQNYWLHIGTPKNLQEVERFLITNDHAN